VRASHVGWLGRTEGSWEFHLADEDRYRDGLSAFRYALHPEGYVVYRVKTGWDARGPQDERERLIDLRATTSAFYVLQVAAMSAAVTVYFFDKTLMAHAVILALAVSELARHGGIILGYRRPC
jgi:hypothetical protein